MEGAMTKVDLLRAATIATITLVAGACQTPPPLIEASNGDRDAGASGSDAEATGPDATDGASASGIVLVTNSVGVIEPNAAGVVGTWYAFADGYDVNGHFGAGLCQVAGHADCSMFTQPVPNQPFAPGVGGAMCTAGHVAQVPTSASGSPDYTNVYGATIGMDFNRPPGAATKGDYDPTRSTPRIAGIAFDIDTVPDGSLRVELSTNAVPGTTDINPAYWGGAVSSSPVRPGHNVFHWSDVDGPFYLQSPPPFDPAKLQSLWFGVFADATAPFDFAFCISNLTLLTQ
jgi:hypothetical protein